MIVHRTEFAATDRGIKSDRMSCFAGRPCQVPASILAEIVFEANAMDLRELRIQGFGAREYLLHSVNPIRIVRIVEVGYPHVSIRKLRVGQGEVRIQFSRSPKILRCRLYELKITDSD